MLPFPPRRDDRKAYLNRLSYLADKVQSQVRPARLCNALEAVYATMGSQYGDDGFPWITLVLGSGCLEAPEAADGSSLDDSPEAIRRMFIGRKQLAGNLDTSKLARDFARSLIEDRLGADTANRLGGTRPGEATAQVSVLAANLVLAAALLTRFYHLAAAGRPEALTRSGQDVVTLRQLGPATAALRGDLLEPLRAVLNDIDSSGEAAELVMLNSLLAELRRTLYPTIGAPTLKVANLQLLTELSWYYLTERTTVYPGWSDLLLHLSTQEHPATIDHGHPRPAFLSVTGATALIASRYQDATVRSWESLGDGKHTERERFYAAAAAVLREEAKIRMAIPEATRRPPIASAFVTTFDLELEMAIWSSSTQPFLVAMPVTLLRADSRGEAGSRIASTCWLACEIRPDHTPARAAQLSALLHPQNWFVLSAENSYDLRYGSKPVVVRLNGCPLLTLPELRAGDEWTPLCRDLLRHLGVREPKMPASGGATPLELVHAVLLDEYAAMQQTATEFYNYTPNNVTSETVRYGLPQTITGGDGSMFARFWMVMGVQIGDSSVRYRFTSQMVSPKLSSGRSSRARTPNRSGAVINRRIDTTVRDLLYWYSFDVVTDRCEKFTEDLEHYVIHLRGPQRRSSVDKICDLK